MGSSKTQPTSGPCGSTMTPTCSSMKKSMRHFNLKEKWMNHVAMKLPEREIYKAAISSLPIDIVPAESVSRHRVGTIG